MIRRLLIANRGEIAVRVIRACREAGISPAAVYSEADRTALHVSLADAAIEIGPGPAVESYLDTGRILDAARQCGADAVHPGYGFLSENASFAAAVREAGLTFVGPTPEAIQLLGDKSSARRLAQSLGIPVVPGYAGEDVSDSRLRAEAAGVGLPLLIKASAGGGGRGMQVVRRMEELAAALDEARREAAAAFGDDRVFLERLVERPRHVEFQVYGDSTGQAVTLYERECSIQRRRQKVLEESPCLALDAGLRQEMGQAAIRLVQASGYTNAGTVEFLVEGSRFYFLEVNTRLQVEHPVTELVTGLDLVRLQIRLAEGSPLPFPQEEVHVTGHAIEARITAEDPADNFAPCSGPVLHWSHPSWPWLRVDTGVATGSEVPPYYDSLLAKMIAWGPTREEAVRRLDCGLSQLHILGVRSNAGFLRQVLAHPGFQAGQFSTQFLEDHFPNGAALPEPPAEILLALAATGSLAPAPAAAPKESLSTPWESGGRWRNA